MYVLWVVRKNKLTNSNILKPTHRVCISYAKIQTDTFLLISDKNVISSNLGVTIVKGYHVIYLRKKYIKIVKKTAVPEQS